MPGTESRDFVSPDETRTPAKTLIELVNVAGGQIGRYTFQPGWRWSECIKPVVNTERCQTEHIGYAVSGSLHIKDSDGTETDITAGDVYRIAPGHDAWNAGSEPAVFVEFQGAANYAVLTTGCGRGQGGRGKTRRPATILVAKSADFTRRRSCGGR